MGGNAGNRQDNRQRGNAAQLLEKYKNMARDAQLAGDRVQTEYYLQFADHYFRVLEENRSRFEDQNSRRRRDEDDDEDGDEMMDVEADGDDGEEDERPQRRQTRDRGDRPERAERPQRTERPRRERTNGQARDEAGETIAMDALPPAIGADGDEGEDEVAAKPRRRRLKTKSEDEGDSAADAA